MTTTVTVAPRITGDPQLIHGGSQALDAVAQTIATTTLELRQARAGTTMAGESIDAYLEAAAAIEEALSQVESRYSAAAASLASYAASLTDLQAQAADLELRRRWAQDDLDAAQRRMREAGPDSEVEGGVGTASLDAMLDHTQAAHAAAEQDADDARALLASYDEQLEELVGDWCAIVRARARDIDVVVEGSDLNDSAWDGFCGLLETVLDDWLPDIEIALDVLAVVLTVVAVGCALTGGGAALAPVLFALSRAAQLGARAVAAVKATATCILVVSGKRPLTDLAAVGVDYVAGRVHSKALDGVLHVGSRYAGRTFSSTAGRVGSFLHDALDGDGSVAGRAATLEARLTRTTFEDWVRTRLDPVANAESVRLGRWTVSTQGLLDAENRWNAMDDVVVGGVLDLGGGHGALDGWTDVMSRTTAGEHALSGLSYQVVDVCQEVRGAFASPSTQKNAEVVS
ncbi:hypothetical protein [Demequina capsici]|uniref:Uncharacterized protein n=1 Tax=Demequina capsici TaxID=3075620 RepID=A0AA96F7E1_9MICO|nr:hypothetical protein [Demequina sp. OYTSA14]WNM24115.1 hypothetical protein RN606_12205 [Demequina sp. OYTSA14]